MSFNLRLGTDAKSLPSLAQLNQVRGSLSSVEAIFAPLIPYSSQLKLPCLLVRLALLLKYHSFVSPSSCIGVGG